MGRPKGSKNGVRSVVRIHKTKVPKSVPGLSPEQLAIRQLTALVEDENQDTEVRKAAGRALVKALTPKTQDTGPLRKFTMDVDHLEDLFGPTAPAPRPVVKPETREQAEARWARERAAREAKNIEDAKNYPPREVFPELELAQRCAPKPTPLVDPSAFREQEIWSKARSAPRYDVEIIKW